MNAKGILDQLMKQAGGGASRGAGVDDLLRQVTSKLGGSTGQAKAGGLDLQNLLGSGAIGLLLGSKRGRRMGGKALKYGALAGIGALAWKAWQNHQAGAERAGGDVGGPRIDELQGAAGEQRSLEILQAMIMAARADGHIDEAERAQLTQHMEGLGADAELRAWMEEQMNAPLDAQALARQADSPQAAREMYLVSAAIVDEQDPMERAWLDQLASALQIEPGLAAELERQAGAAA